MNAADQRELEQVALAGELAGQLRHDVGSFVYHLSLKLDLLETMPDHPLDWASVKREGKELIEHLKEWDRYRGSSQEPREIDLNPLVQNCARKFHREGPKSKITVHLAPEPALLVTRAGEAKRLLDLLLTHSVLSARAANDYDWALSVATFADGQYVQVRIQGAAPGGWQVLLETEGKSATESPSLVIKACKSLVLRLDAKLRAELQANSKVTIVLEFPKEGRKQ